MAERIREKVIRISYSKHLELKKWALLICLLALGLTLRHIWIAAQAPILISTLVSLIMVIEIWECFYAIRKNNIELVEKNKIVNVVLSEAMVWEWPIIWLIVYPYGCTICIYDGIGWTVVVSIVYIVLVVAVSILLAGIFNKRLIK